MSRQVKFEDEVRTGEQGSFRNRSLSTWSKEQPDEPLGNVEKIRKFSRDIMETVRRKSYVDSICVEENVDGGYAWIILIVIFVINSSTFGSARAYGLIFEYSARQDQQPRAQAALPFTIMGAVENMAGPLAGYLLVRTGSWRKVVLAGSCLLTLSHLMAAQLSSAPGQILTMGVMCGVGQSFVSISSFQINNAYFQRYRSRAFGVGLTGAAVGTIYISPLCTLVLENHGKALCYIALSLILFPNVALSLLLKLKDKTPMHLTQPDDSQQNSRRNSYDNDMPTLMATGRRTSRRKFSIHEFALAAVAADTTIAAQLPTLATITAATMTTAPDGTVSKRRHSEWPAIFTFSRRRQSEEAKAAAREQQQQQATSVAVTIEEADESLEDEDGDGFGAKVREVFTTPMFHLIWPTQLLFCWLNFVIGMTITDFGRDRGLTDAQNARLIVVWATGQVFGRLCLGSLIDIQIISYKSFTSLCFASISLTICTLNTLGRAGSADHPDGHMLIYALVFILSMFIATLYILFNGLVQNYMELSVAPLSIGISSFTGSFFLLPRAWVIGKYRDTCGNYDSMLTMFACVTLISALVWLLVPALILYLKRCRPNEPASFQNEKHEERRPRGGRPEAAPPQPEHVKRCFSLPINQRTNAARIKELLNDISSSSSSSTRRISPGQPTGLGQIPTIEEEQL